MPVVELDMLVALVNRHDRFHKLADELFAKVAAGKVRVAVAASALVEYELLLRSRGYPEKDVRRDLRAFKELLPDVPLSSDVVVIASEMREEYGLTYFDSLHAASALVLDGVIVSMDRDYEGVKGLKAVKPEEFLAEL